MSTSPAVPTQTCSGRAGGRAHLLMVTSARARAGHAELGHLTQSAKVWLCFRPFGRWYTWVPPLCPVQRLLIPTSFCMWCTRNITCSWPPQSSLVQWHEVQAYSLVLLFPSAAPAHQVVIAEHRGCVAAASHRGDQFLPRVHQGRKHWGKQACYHSYPTHIPDGSWHRHVPVHRRRSQTQEVYEMGGEEKQHRPPLSITSEIRKPSSFFPCMDLLWNQIFMGNRNSFYNNKV